MIKRIWLIFLCCGHLAASAQSDNCATATVLTECTLTPSANAGATTGADDSYLPTDICATSVDNSTWYSFTPAQTGAYTVTVSNMACTGSTQLEIGVFSGTCGALVPETCNQGTGSFSTSINLVAGQNYFIVIDGTAGSDCSFDLMACPGCDAVATFVSSASAGAYPFTVNFTNTSPGGAFYHWDFGAGGATFDGTHASFTYDEPGTFIVTLSAFNGVCYTTFTDTISVTGSSSLTIPNVFTPNGDEQNDLFVIGCAGIKTLDVQIYNRWGELVGFWEGPNGYWDGFSVMAGVKMAEGPYFYRVKAEGYDGVTYDQKGYLQLFR